jgi:hypothetical protein
MVTYCPSCGTQYVEGAHYCHHCGRSLHGEHALSLPWRTEYREIYLDWSDDPVSVPTIRDPQHERLLENLVLEGIKPYLAEGWDRDAGASRGMTFDEQVQRRFLGRRQTMVSGCWVKLRRVVR